MKITLLTTTYNRSKLLRRTIGSMLGQDLSKISADLEYIIVDNNSSDDTRAVVMGFQTESKNIKIKYISEPKQGINYARNNGIRNSDGEYILLIDDDVVLGENWLYSYIEAFIKYPSYDVFAGPVELEEPNYKLPNWLKTSGPYWRNSIVLILNFGEYDSIQCFRDAMPYGPNMAFKRLVFEKYGNFREDIGLKGNKLMPGSEYELFTRLRNNGLEFWIYVPGAGVKHPIKRSQATKSYFRKRLFGIGRATARIHTFRAKIKFFNVPVYLAIKLLKMVLFAVKAKIKRRDAESFYYETEAINVAGCMYELARIKEQ